MAADLVFPLSYKRDGFTTEVTSREAGDPDPVVRELLQNGLDAAVREANRVPAVVWFTLTDAVWMAFVFAAWHGLSFGAQLPLNRISFPDYFGRYSVGRIRSVTAPPQLVLNAFGPYVSGLVIDNRGSYDLIYVIFIGLLLLAALSILSAAKPSPPARARV